MRVPPVLAGLSGVFRPFSQQGTILLVELGWWVEGRIKEGRHFTFFYFFPNFFDHVDLFIFVVPVPGGKVHVVSGFVDVVGDQPRERRDIAIPRPLAFVGVAVLAGSLKDRADFLRCGDFRFDRRVLPVDWYQLKYQENDSDTRPHFCLDAHRCLY